MPSGGSTGSQVTTTNSDPWLGQQPYLNYGFQEAQRQYQHPSPGFFPQSTVTPFATETTQAQNMQKQRALTGSPVMGAAQGELQNTIEGQYLDAGNPHLASVAQSVSDVISPQIASQFEMYGRQGSGAQETETARQMANAMAPLAYGDYSGEREKQMRAMGMAPSFAQQDYADIGQLANVGAQKEAMGEAQLSDLIQRHNFAQLSPSNKLAAYQQAIQGSYGGQSTVTQPTYRSSPMMGALGGGMSGAYMGGMMTPQGSQMNYMWPLAGAALGAYG